jgi:ATP/maltotriose-dependent transcriptional regulator MalT
MLELASFLVLEIDPQRHRLERVGTLSHRESEVLSLVSLGLSNMQIAGRLAVSTHAVKFHLASVYRKLGVANRTEASSYFLLSQLAQADQEAVG